jgi:lipopolysaccharide/colanic/teichoic acid biosynthesis glycosyltransferase
VIRGEMSLVGPRPPIERELQGYEPAYYVRFSTTPGLTGPWQVSGRSLITQFEHVIELERAYIAQWNLWKDGLILLKTIPTVLFGRGSA